MILLLLYALALRGFLFEIKFEYTRHLLRKKSELFEIFLDCSFCNGFWSGLFVFIIFKGFAWEMLFFAITVGFLAYLTHLFLDTIEGEK